MLKKLADMKPGEEGVIVRIDQSIRTHIAGMGIRDGEKLKLTTEQPIRGPLVIAIKGRETSLGRKLAQLILVECEE